MAFLQDYLLQKSIIEYELINTEMKKMQKYFLDDMEVSEEVYNHELEECA